MSDSETLEAAPKGSAREGGDPAVLGAVLAYLEKRGLPNTARKMRRELEAEGVDVAAAEAAAEGHRLIAMARVSRWRKEEIAEFDRVLFRHGAENPKIVELVERAVPSRSQKSIRRYLERRLARSSGILKRPQRA